MKSMSILFVLLMGTASPAAELLNAVCVLGSSYKFEEYAYQGDRVTIQNGEVILEKYRPFNQRFEEEVNLTRNYPQAICKVSSAIGKSSKTIFKNDMVARCVTSKRAQFTSRFNHLMLNGTDFSGMKNIPIALVKYSPNAATSKDASLSEIMGDGTRCTITLESIR